ncbi:MAG: hypothetical protein ACW98I_08445 [Candidatus Hodarchaeales archaeon]|jgi:hypothetical protein
MHRKKSRKKSDESQRTPPKKRTKKPPNIISSVDIRKNVYLQKISNHFCFEWIKPNFRKWVQRKLEKELSQPRYSDYPDEKILEIRISKLLEPYENLLNYLSRIKDEDSTKRYLNLILGLPFTLTQIANEFDDWDRTEFKSRRRAIERLVEKFEAAGILKVGWIHDEKWGIPYSRKQWNSRFWYIPNYHTDDDIKNWVIRKYSDYAKGLGRREDKEMKLSREEKKQLKQQQLKLEKEEKDKKIRIMELEKEIMTKESTLEKWKRLPPTRNLHQDIELFERCIGEANAELEKLRE